MYTCAQCKIHSCRSGELEMMPGNCPCGEDQTEIKELYKDEIDQKIAYQAALVEAEGYCEKTRLEETIDFAQRCGFHKLGLAFCLGLSKEAAVISKVLQHNGFEVHSVICKNGSTPKEYLGIDEEHKIRPGTYEPMCNPIGQAVLLNKAGTDFNIVVGLCVGHDTLFIRHSEAPVTVFAVKDRVLAHNPLGAVYLAEGFYKKKLYK
ncbi:MAG: DUF1847 domain-containing protein [Bacillota bacterium]